MGKDINEQLGMDKDKYNYIDAKFDKWLVNFMEPSWEDQDILRDARINHLKSKLYPAIRGVWKDFFGRPMPDLVLRSKIFDVFYRRCRESEENINKILKDETLTSAEKMWVINHNSAIWNSELEELASALGINKKEDKRRQWA